MKNVTAPMKIDPKDYFNGRDPNSFGQEIASNSVQLLSRVNILLADYSEWLEEENQVLRPQKATVTSGLRTRPENTAIYKAINNRRIAMGQPPIPEATKSAHLTAEAVDIYDQYHLFQEYLRTDRAKALYEQLDLYFEDFAHTPNWVHITTRKPASGNRFFIP